ncbi:MAG: extracellular matrix regulator RemB [Intestinibacillus sp.]
MYVHLGQDYIVPVRSIIGIFDMDTATVSKHTRAFVARMEREARAIPVFEDLPKSAVLCETELGERLYISQISTSTLAQRVERLQKGDFL